MKLSDKDKRSKSVVVDSIRTSYQFLLECISFKRKNYFYLCYQFFKQIREKYDGKKPIYTDGAQWYVDACKWLRLKHIVYGTELKNIMERFIQQIKDRTECFDDHFPCRRRKEDYYCDRQHVWNWLKLFILYLHLDADRVRFTTVFLTMEGGDGLS